MTGLGARRGIGRASGTAGNPGRVLQVVLNNIAGQRANVVAIQRELVTRSALNPESGGNGEEEKARWIESWLHQQRIPAERVDSPDIRVPAGVRPNMIIRWPGESESMLWVVCHMDVSPPGPESLWTGSPWALRVDGDNIHGRGTLDNNQCITTGLILLQALVKEQATPHRGFGLLLISGGKSAFPEANPLFTPAVSTFSVTHAEAGSGVYNQIPGLFVFYMDCRLMPGYTADEVQAAVRAMADEAEKQGRVTVGIERIGAVPTMPSTSATAPAVLFLRKAIAEELKVEPQLTGNGAVTIAAELRMRKLPVAVWQLGDNLGDMVD